MVETAWDSNALDSPLVCFLSLRNESNECSPMFQFSLLCGYCLFVMAWKGIVGGAGMAFGRKRKECVCWV